MKKKQRGSAAEMQSFFGSVRQMLTTFPREGEREEVLESLDAILQFLVEARDRIAKLPNSEAVSEVAEAASTLESFFSKGDSDPLVQAIFGRRIPKRPRNGASTSDHSQRAEQDLREFQSLSTQDVQSKLNDSEAFPMARLRAIAHQLGIAGLRNIDRVSLIHHITTRISNQRGYRSLREGNPSQAVSVGESPRSNYDS
jgi:hypothetical protein